LTLVGEYQIFEPEFGRSWEGHLGRGDLHKWIGNNTRAQLLPTFFMADRFENKSKIEAIVLKEIKEMKMGCSFRTIVPVGRRFLKK